MCKKNKQAKTPKKNIQTNDQNNKKTTHTINETKRKRNTNKNPTFIQNFTHRECLDSII